MKLVVANIPSKSPYYVNEVGEVFNKKGEKLKGSINKTSNRSIRRMLHYKDNFGIRRGILFGRLIYNTFSKLPANKDQAVVLIDSEKEFPYSFNNLKCIDKKDCIEYSEADKYNYSQGRKLFYENFNIKQLNEMLEFITSHTLRESAEKYGVSDMSIHRAKKRLKL